MNKENCHAVSEKATAHSKGVSFSNSKLPQLIELYLMFTIYKCN